MASLCGTDIDADRDAKRRELKANLAAHDCDEVEPLRVAVEAAQMVGLGDEDVLQGQSLLQHLESQLQPLTFTDVLQDKMEQLQATSSRAQACNVLAECLNISSAIDGFRADILMEFHYNNFVFTQHQRFCVEKASTFLSLMNVLHTKGIVESGSTCSHSMRYQAARDLFEALLARHGRQLPPYSVGVFSTDEASAIRGFVDRSFFRHFAMYSFAYEHRVHAVVQLAVPTATRMVPANTQFFSQHEVDPEDVDELRDELFCGLDAQVEQPESAGLSFLKMSSQYKSRRPDPALPQPAKDAPGEEAAQAVSTVFEEVCAAHLEDFASKLKLPEF